MSAPTLASVLSVEAMGWALLHSLWQGAALWLGLEAALAWPRLVSPRVRGRLAGAALTVFVLMVTATYGWMAREGKANAGATARESGEASAATAASMAAATLRVDSAGADRVAMAGTEKANAAAVTGKGAGVGATRPWRARVRPVLPWVVGLWAAGVVVGLVRHGREWLALRGLRRAVLTELPPEWRERFAALCMRCAPGWRLPRIGETATVRVPLVIGGVAPLILLPAGFLAGLTPAQVEAVLAHELAHLVRRDFWINLLQCLAEAVFFFHPAVHAFGAHIRRERERACDDCAVAWTGDALGYVKALATLAGAGAGGGAHGMALAADGHEPGDLLARIRRLLGVPAARRREGLAELVSRRALGLLVTVGAVLVYAGLFAAAPVIVARVMPPEKRIELVKEALAESREEPAPRPVFPTGMIELVSELRTADGSPVPARVGGAFDTVNGENGESRSLEWVNGRASIQVPRGLVSVLAVAEGWAPVALHSQAPGEGAQKLILPVLTLRRGRPLTLRLRDEDGAPLGGVRISVHVRVAAGHSLSGIGVPHAPVRSDEDGLALLPQVDPEFVYRLEAELTGRQNVWRTLSRAEAGAGAVEWLLPKAEAITGRVVDADDGKPVAGVGVSLRAATNPTKVRFQLMPLDPPLTTTGADGRFELPGWDEDGVYGLVFHQEDYASQPVLARPGNEVNATVRKGGFKLSGRIRLAPGAREWLPQGGIKVQRLLELEAYRTLPVTLASDRPRREGDEYAFAFSHLPGGPLMIEVNGVKSRARVDLNGDRSGVVLVLDEQWLWMAEEWPGMASADAGQARTVVARTVELVLNTKDGGPAPSGRLWLSIVPPGLEEASASTAFYELREGRVELRDLIPGSRIRINARANIPGYTVAGQSIVVEAGDGVQRQVIEASPAGVIRVELRDERDAPLVGAEVCLFGKEAPPPAVPYFDLGGSGFRQSHRGAFGGVPLDGTYYVKATHEGRQLQSEPITLTGAEPLAEVRLKFYPAETVAIRVVGPDGNPVSGVKLGLGCQRIGFESWGLENFRTDNEGGFQLRGMTRAAGTGYLLHVAFVRDWQPMVVRFAGDAPQPWILEAKPGLRASGRVVRADGSAVSGVHPSVFSLREKGALGSNLPVALADTVTDAEGRFQFSNLPPGRLRFLTGRKRPEGVSFTELEVPVAEGTELRLVVE